MNASNSIHKSFCQFICWCFTFRIPKVQHQCFPRNSFTQHSQVAVTCTDLAGARRLLLFCAKAESHRRAQTRSSSPSLNPGASFSVLHSSFPILTGKAVYLTSTSFSGICHQFSAQVQHIQLLLQSALVPSFP